MFRPRIDDLPFSCVGFQEQVHIPRFFECHLYGDTSEAAICRSDVLHASMFRSVAIREA